MPSDEQAGGKERQAGSSGEDEQTAGGPPGRPASGDGELDAALDVFDGEILAERAEILARNNETAGQRGPDELPGSEQEQSDDPPGGAQGTPEAGAMPTGGPRRTPPPPTSSPIPGAPVPEDIPDARDDDVVARQLREAAMAEADPQLREALWEEYRRYNAGR